MLEFHALGGLTVTESGDELSIGGPRQRRLLAMLLIHRNSVVSVDRLADAVFAGEPTPAASTTLRSYVARIRRVVDADGSAPMVVTQAPGYVLPGAGRGVRRRPLRASVAEAGSRLGRGDAAGASSVLREALGLWRGDAYAEFADEDWARPEAQRLRRAAARRPRTSRRGRAGLRPRRGDDPGDRVAGRRAPAAGGVPGAADDRPLPRRSPGRRARASSATTAACSSRSSASSRRRRWRSSSGGCSPTTRR